MKKTSLRKNRFSARAKRFPDNFLEHSGEAVSLREMMMQQWEFNDADIAERMAATLSRPISPEAQAFYDHMDAVLEGKASIGDLLKPVVSEAA